jgi:MYXO-CTERM domain-containing protein
MNRRTVRSGAVALAALATVLPVQAANLLTNPGFESPTDLTNSESTTINGWTVVPSAKRAIFQNHTPGGRWGLWARTFEPSGGVFQNVSGISAGTTYTFTSQLYFEQNFNQTTATVLGSLTWLDAGGGQVGSPSSFMIPFSANPTPNVWTPFTISPVAPTGATQVRVFVGWQDGGGSGPSLSAFFDDLDLEGAGTPPSSTWILNGSGDWNVPDNWANVQTPNAVGAEANFFGAITAPHTVFTDTGVTVGTMSFNNSNTYVIAGAGSLTLQAAGTSAARVNVLSGTHKINLPTLVNSDTTLNVSSGATLKISDPMTIATGKVVTQTGPGTVTYESIVTAQGGAGIAFSNSSHMAGLNLAAAANATLTVGGNKTQKIDVLSLSSTSKFDLNDNDMVVSGGMSKQQIIDSIRTARANGAWTGNGITSTSARNAPQHNTTLGVLSGAEYNSVGGSGNFNGQAYTTGDTLVKYTWYGDTDFNGRVNFDDYVRTDNGFNNHLTGWLNGDFDGNNTVNFDDYVLIDLAFNTQSGTLGRAMKFLDGSDTSLDGMNGAALRTMQDHLSQFGSDYADHFLAAVPEPGALGLAGVALLGALRRRRR